MQNGLMLHESYRTGMSIFIKGLMKAQTTQECVRALNDCGLFNGRCDLNSIPLSIAKQVGMAYFKLFIDFPFLAGRIDAVGTYRSNSSTFAHCHMEKANGDFDGGAVHLNISYYKDGRSFDRHYRGAGQEGFHPENTDYKAVIIHELGHVLDGYLSGIGICGRNKKGERIRLSAYLRKKAFKMLDSKPAEIAQSVSGYAKKSMAEWFAECFAEYMASPKPRAMCIECMYQLKQLLQQEYARQMMEVLVKHSHKIK